MTVSDEFLNGYIRCALWTEDLDGELSEEALQRAKRDCETFAAATHMHTGHIDDTQLGHDLWLTRNRHGAGFWDRGHSELLGDFLTLAAHSLHECILYEGDDGELHLA